MLWEVPELELKVENLSKAWHGFKLHKIDLTIATGEYFILLGPTGAGKTLLLETIMGFHTPDVGRILLNDVDVTRFPPEKRGIGYVPQTCVLFPHMNVRKNVEFGLRMQRIPEAQRKQIVDQTLNSLGISSLAHRSPDTLSGGEKQKVSLARVLATQPQLLLLDEPLTGLGTESAKEIRAKLRQIHREGKTVVHVTHNQAEGFSLGNRMGIIRAGKLVQTGETAEVISNPTSEYVARFLGYENVFKAQVLKVQNSWSVVQVGQVELKVLEKISAPECTIALRPEDVAIRMSPQAADNSLNVLEATVVDFLDQGHFVAVTLDAGLKFEALTTRHDFIVNRLGIGQKVHLTIPSDAIKTVKQSADKTEPDSPSN
jgi:ABC-type Fe3+/spermidine/putrescine transport system ATPase subunit